MDKNILGLLFILTGLVYGSLALDGIYSLTLGYLVEHNWIRPPAPGKLNKFVFGRKPTILFYSLALIAAGIFIIIKLD